jgi:hypothetical protein
VAGWSRLTTVGFSPAEREERRAWQRSGQHELIAAGQARGHAPWAIAAALLWQLMMLGMPHDIGRWLRCVGLPGLRRRLLSAWREWRDTALFAVAVYALGTMLLSLEPLTTLRRELPAPLFWVLWISAACPWWRLVRATWRVVAQRRSPGGEADQAQPREQAGPGTPRGAGSATGMAEERTSVLRCRRVVAVRCEAIRRRRAADRGPRAVGMSLLWSGRSWPNRAGRPLMEALDWWRTAQSLRPSAAWTATRPWTTSPTVRLWTTPEPAALRSRGHRPGAGSRR